MNLQNLTNLVLRSNSLVNIPDEITDIKSLKLLDLSHNAITNLPSAMGNLINLCSVNLSNNKVGILNSFSSSDSKIIKLFFNMA